MSTSSSTNHIYSLFYRRLHWSLASIIISLLILGQQFHFDISDSYRIHGLKAHSTLGSISLFIVLTFIVKRFVFRRPTPTPKLSIMKIIMARSVQFCLYFLAVFVPISGAICAMHSAYPVYLFGVFDLSQLQPSSESSFAYLRTIHVWGTRVLIFFLLSHAGAAFYHHFIVKDGVLKSMLVNDPLLSSIWKRVMRKRLVKNI